MSKSKRNLSRKPQEHHNDFDFNEVIRRCVVPEAEDDTSEYVSEELMDYVCEYNDVYAVPDEDEIPGRKNYPYRDLGEIRDLLGRSSRDLTELINHVVNDTDVSPDNGYLHLNNEERLKDYYRLDHLRDIVNKKLDYDGVLENYVNNLKDGLLMLPDELCRERALLIFSLQDLLGSFLNMSCQKEIYHDIIEHALIDTIRKLADNKIKGDEAKKIARELEIKLDGFTRLNENIGDDKIFRPVIELEDLGYPGSDERMSYNCDYSEE